MNDNDIAKAAIEAWLDEFEGFACRAERLGEDAATSRPLEPWLREAFKMGLAAGRAEVARLTAERDAQAKTIQSSADCFHRLAERADDLEGMIATLADVRQWPYYPIEMPLTAAGHGPATVGHNATKITYEVWDRACASHGSFTNLPDAVNEAMRLTVEYISTAHQETAS